ncbi:hypothetical protein TcBrA4_0022350 [Trypanosoma cruzi]|nr:hypothetical protein TcBrA4_0022350 [Trypanosoma cruzi]
MRGSVICRDHAAGVHDIRHQWQPNSSGSVDGEERAWSRTVSPTSTEQGLPGASVPVAESIETSRGTPPKDVDLAAPRKHPLTEEKCIRPGGPDGLQEASLGGRDRSSETDGRQASDSQ